MGSCKRQALLANESNNESSIPKVHFAHSSYFVSFETTSEMSQRQSQTRPSLFSEIIIIFSVSNVALNYLHKGGTKEREER